MYLLPNAEKTRPGQFSVCYPGGIRYVSLSVQALWYTKHVEVHQSKELMGEKVAANFGKNCLTGEIQIKVQQHSSIWLDSR